MFNLFRKTESSWKDLRAEELKDFLKQNPKAGILDVRGETEARMDGEIPGSRRAELHGGGFAEAVGKLDTSRPWVVYCRSGNRSRMACQYLTDKGFTDLYNLQGGMGAYRRLGDNS